MHDYLITYNRLGLKNVLVRFKSSIGFGTPATEFFSEEKNITMLPT